MNSSGGRSAASVLSQPHLTAISDLACLQNVHLSAAEAVELHRLQDDFLRTSLVRGFASLAACLGEPGEGGAPADGAPRASAHFRSIIGQLVVITGALTAHLEALAVPLTAEGEAALEEHLREAAFSVRRCYEAIHEPPRGGSRSDFGAPTDHEILFLEFMAGLCMAWFATEVRRLVITDLLRSAREAFPALSADGAADQLLHSLWSLRPGSHGVRGLAGQHSPEIAVFARVIDVIYFDAALSVTSDAIDHCHQFCTHDALLEEICASLVRRPAAGAAMKAICSMRHIPSEEPGSLPYPGAGGARAGILGMAQALHWSGIGSENSGLWLDHEPLRLLAHHSLSYADNFSKAAQVLGDLICDMRTHAREATARYLLEMPEPGGPGPEAAGPGERGRARIYRVIEDASGPSAQFASEVARRLDELRSDRGGAVLHLSAADASGANLLSLVEHEKKGSTPAAGEACRIESVRYRDLTLPLLHGLEGDDPGSLESRYDAYLVGLALHHVTDGVCGLDFLLNVLQFSTYVVRPGGCLAFLEVTELAPAVEMLVPLDLADRVGSFPHDIHETFSFAALAVAGRSGSGSERRVKLPWQVKELGRSFPSQERPATTFALFSVVEIPEALVAPLDELRAAQGFERCAQLLQGNLAPGARPTPAR